jgi:putative nucleotidyltransferase with HDIG domain
VNSITEFESIIAREEDAIIIYLEEKEQLYSISIERAFEQNKKNYLIVLTRESKFNESYLTNAHRVLPFDIKAEKLNSHIEELLRLKEYSYPKELLLKIRSMGSIPVLPEIYIRLERELCKPIVSNIRIAEIISSDAVIVAKILHIAHSAFFNMPEGMLDLTYAINLLGINIVKTIVLHTKIFMLKDFSEPAREVLKRIGRHSIEVAKLSKRILENEKASKQEIERAYIAGLLHDIGKVLLVQFADSSKNIDYFPHANQVNTTEKENELFGMNHVDAGLYILTLWGFNKEILEVVKFHHHSDCVKDNTISVLASVYLANLLTYEHTNFVDELPASLKEKISIFINA